MTPVLVEFAKLKRSKIIWVCLAGPFLVALLFFLLQISGNSLQLWPMHIYAGFGAWAYFMLPMTATVIATLMAQLEHGPKTWAHLFVQPVAKWRIIQAKAIVTLILLAVMSVLVGAFMVAGGWLGGEVNPDAALTSPDEIAGFLRNVPAGALEEMDDTGDMPFGGDIARMLTDSDWRWTLAERLGLIYLSAFLLTAIQLWAALLFRNFLIPLSLGVGGGFVAVVAQASEYGIYFPWLLPVNMLQMDAARMQFALALGFGGGLLAFALMIWQTSRMQIK